MKKLNRKQLLSIAVFTVVGLIALQINLAHIAGSKVSFTMFDSYGPIAAGILGALPGMIALVALQIINALIHKQSLASLPLLLHFIPILGAAWYFRKRNFANLFIPMLAIIIFNLN